MERHIAIEPKLTPLKDYLTARGYHVESKSFGRSTVLKTGAAYDAIIVANSPDKLIGLNDAGSGTVVIEAKGLTPEQIARELEIKLE